MGGRTAAQGLSRALLAVMAVIALCWPGAISASAADAYLLGSQDRLRIKVYEWRAASSDAHEWTALTGEFSIAASGDVSLPLIGEVPAAGKTTADLAVIIAEGLQRKIGLSKRPDASVEVVEYRPFYIMGVVAKPGQYPCIPRLNVLQAISTAGGILAVTDLGILNLEREALVSRGDLRVLSAERLGLVARRARLEAELQDSAAVDFPAELKEQAKAPAIARLMREEQLLFESRRQALRSQVEALTQTKSLLSNEVETLKAKSVALQRQLDIARKELDSVNSLVSKGLAVTSRQLALDQNASQFDSSRLDINLLILRAQQDIAKADRDILDLRNRRRDEILTETADVRAKLAANVEKADTAQALVYNLDVRAPQAAMARLGDPSQKLRIAIARRVNGDVVTLSAGETDTVEPGDIVRVERPSTATSAYGTETYGAASR
jgi:polysaccharide export outer membrane protein